ncbi:S8 family serine peptidase [Flavihumibacter solisilvae]|uniref:S8 family serine peptidase n=1 Tax=Flavihumibacter solisilvae TaxID=1349421 RepID=UPI0009078086|nr:S8 family serine peptidase [Flavihumibacter solisilvae]
MFTYTLGGKNGKKVSLQESNDRVVVRTRNARPLSDAIFTDEGRQTLEDFNIEEQFPEADITILKAKSDRAGEALRDGARQVLKNEPELRFAGRVLVDAETKKPVVYTENIFIKFYDNVSADTCEKILAENNLVIKQKLDFAVNSYFVSAPENTGLQVFEIAESLLKRNEVELCHPEVIRKKSLKVINSNQWHLKATTIGGVAITANANVEAAHAITEGENIVVAIIDDGVDISNPEFNLPGKVADGRDITLNINDPRPKQSFDNHGTACAGVATAAGVNASGVAPKAKLMPIRLSSNLGSIAEANAFKWAVDHGADIISCSWGPQDGDWSDLTDPTHTTQVDLPDSTRLAIDDAVTRGRNGKGCVIFFAAGNGNEDVKFDGYASYQNVTAVAASNDTDRRSVYSDFGDQVWCAFPSNDFGHVPFNHPDALTAGIFTTDRTGSAGYNSGGDYTETFGGTSSACPGAAGTAALILSANPELTWQQVRDIIAETCDKIDTANGAYNASGRSPFYGHGRINAEKAVRMAKQLQTVTVGSRVKIISALVNPEALDLGNEKVSLLNTTANSIDLSGWAIEVKGKKQSLLFTLAGGEAKSIRLLTARLANSGATINLIDSQQNTVHSVTYRKADVVEGVTIEF